MTTKTNDVIDLTLEDDTKSSTKQRRRIIHPEIISIDDDNDDAFGPVGEQPEEEDDSVGVVHRLGTLRCEVSP